MIKKNMSSLSEVKSYFLINAFLPEIKFATHNWNSNFKFFILKKINSGVHYKIFPTNTMFTVKDKINDGSFAPLKDGFAGKKIELLTDSYTRRKRGVGFSYSLTRKGIDTFFGDEGQQYEAEEVASTELDNIKQFLVEFSLVYENHNIPINVKRRPMNNVEEQFSSLPFVKKVQKVIPDNYDRYIFYNCCKDFVLYSSSSSLMKTLEDIYGQGNTYFKKIHEFKDEKTFLLQEGFLVLEKNENINKTALCPSDRAFRLIYGKNADLFVKSDSMNNLIEPAKLKAKELYYPESIVSQIDMLKNSLDNKNLTAMQKRLEAKGLPKGIAVLLYGAAGTGKTESVYQIAKATNRRIYHVDISETKSMWFGESEKLIKRVFVNYRNLCTACERRFLFKIKFEKPGLKERCLIWKCKLPLLSEEDVETLARKYDFSGGEIDNIVRKCEIDEIIKGSVPEFSEIMELCKNERLAKDEERTMGFCLS